MESKDKDARKIKLIGLYFLIGERIQNTEEGEEIVRRGIDLLKKGKPSFHSLKA